MKIKLIISIIISFVLFYMLGAGKVVADDVEDAKLMEEILEKSKRDVDIKGVVQDVEGNSVDGVTLHIWTESLIKAWSENTEEKYYRRVVNSPFYIQLPACHNMSISAEKEGYLRGGCYLREEELSAKDVVIRLLPGGRESRLRHYISPSVKITKADESFMYSFKRGREISLKWKPDPYDIYVYLEVTGEPVSFWDTDTYSVALVGVEVEFCEAFLLPPMKYSGSSFELELIKAPEDGYVSRIEVDNPKDFANRCFYFKTREDKYGKLCIEKDDVYMGDKGIKVCFEYYFQPDGTRDLLPEQYYTPLENLDYTPPETEDNYQYNGVWINKDAEITLTATDDITGIAKTYYTIAQVQHEGTSINITDEGEHTVKYWSVDVAGNVETEKTITVKIDKTPPEVSISMDPSILWPVNQVVEVTINGSATDNLSGISSKEFTVIDEYGEVEASPSDFGNKIELISWRKGADIEGRIYTVSVVVTDKAGNSTTKETTAIVPHDMR